MIIMNQILNDSNIEGDISSIEEVRKEYIRKLSGGLDDNELQLMSEDLFNLGLTVYSKDNDLDSIIYNSVYRSKIDPKISLYPEQLELIMEIKQNNALIVSAPTSFGKTFSVFEYIVQEQPKNIVMIVPTLALVDEYLRKIINKYKKSFERYNKYINFDEETVYNYDKYNIFILTHDKALENNLYRRIEKIDFLVIDEVYKLQKEEDNDRVLVLNLAYYFLASKSSKYVLLAPFISDVEDREKLDKYPQLFKTNFSPVVNEVVTNEIQNDDERDSKIKELISLTSGQKTLIYFPTVTEIPTFVNDVIVPSFPLINIDNVKIKKFIRWIKKEIHKEWYLIKAMERGFLVHNGQLPSNGFRMYQIDLYENSRQFNYLFCTSTILEGVNLCAKNIIITKPARNNSAFDAFDFYNLVGRTGRLYQHYLGIAYYIKSAQDAEYHKEAAIKSIKFEVTDESDDFDFHANDNSDNEEYMSFLQMLGISESDFKENIGNKYKLKRLKKLYESYINMKETLLDELSILKQNGERTRGILINILHSIINNTKERPSTKYVVGFESSIINHLIHKGRYRLNTIIKKVAEYYGDDNIDWIISATMRLKSSYVEHEFYSMCKIIIYFLKIDNIDEENIKIVNDRIISCIDYLYFSDSKCKKTLKDLGVYEYDIDKITDVIGKEHEDINEIIELLKQNTFDNLSYISDYIINRLKND